MAKPNISKYWCVVPGCTSDGRKKRNLEKYPAMEGVDFFPFPTRLKNNKIRKRWISQINRENFEPKRHHRERPQNAVEKRNITSARLDQLQDDNTTETELFNAPPVAAEVIVTAVMEGENTVSHVRSRKLPGITAKSSVVNHDHSYMSEEKSWERS
uniref:THAP-type domain-containing protein n=1 Tax=Magallana gigas TaxID=29159 RepID=A0A8W8I0C2_MAGGI